MTNLIIVNSQRRTPMTRDRARGRRQLRLWKQKQQRDAQRGRIADLFLVDAQDADAEDVDTTGNQGDEERLEERP
jgi:hypothetical protein